MKSSGDDELSVVNGCVYYCLGKESNDLRIVDGCGEDYLYASSQFIPAKAPLQPQKDVWYEKEYSFRKEVAKKFGFESWN